MAGQRWRGSRTRSHLARSTSPARERKDGRSTTRRSAGTTQRGPSGAAAHRHRRSSIRSAGSCWPRRTASGSARSWTRSLVVVSPARTGSAKDGTRLGIPRYCAAADATIAIHRPMPCACLQTLARASGSGCRTSSGRRGGGLLFGTVANMHRAPSSAPPAIPAARMPMPSPGRRSNALASRADALAGCRDVRSQPHLILSANAARQIWDAVGRAVELVRSTRPVSPALRPCDSGHAVIDASMRSVGCRDTAIEAQDPSSSPPVASVDSGARRLTCCATSCARRALECWRSRRSRSTAAVRRPRSSSARLRRPPVAFRDPRVLRPSKRGRATGNLRATLPEPRRARQPDARRALNALQRRLLRRPSCSVRDDVGARAASQLHELSADSVRTRAVSSISAHETSSGHRAGAAQSASARAGDSVLAYSTTRSTDPLRCGLASILQLGPVPQPRSCASPASAIRGLRWPLPQHTHVALRDIPASCFAAPSRSTMPPGCCAAQCHAAETVAW